MTKVDLRWKDEAGNVHLLEEREQDVYSGRGTRVVMYWAVVCRGRRFTTASPPAFVDEAVTCMECLGHVAE